MVVRVVGVLLALLTLGHAQSKPDVKDPGREARKKLFREKFLDHFALGVQAPAEWISETREKNGARWDCSVTYLSGSVGTGEKPFWLDYGNSPQKLVADAKKAGVAPWFTFYILAASAPARYKPGPAEATPINAKVPGTMKEYFGLFKTLMEGAGKEAPWPVMVQLEPDEWNHLLLSGGMNPEKVEIKVGSCGMEELKGLPDNLFGYASALKKLRDLYAPTNVMLGCNPSGWDSGSMSGQRMGQLMKAVAGEWDFAVFETGDRNKGMKGQMPPYGDKIDVTGNLESHLKWIADFHAASGLYVFVWQVACGNTVYATCNNTPGHYGDNLAQMLLEDYPKNPTIGNYVKAGCVGWMFHDGQSEGTRVWDMRKDGITNPPAIAGNAGKKSEHSDDDGGFMRLRGGAYYKKPYPILAKAPPTKTPEGSPPAPTASVERPVIPPATLAAWDAKLKGALAEDLKAGRKIRFTFKTLGQSVEIQGLDDKGAVTMQSSAGAFPYAWPNFSLQDRRNLAVGRIRETRPSSDLCLAAFYQFALGDESAARALLRGVPEADAEPVLSAVAAEKREPTSEKR